MTTKYTTLASESQLRVQLSRPIDLKTVLTGPNSALKIKVNRRAMAEADSTTGMKTQKRYSR